MLLLQINDWLGLISGHVRSKHGSICMMQRSTSQAAIYSLNCTLQARSGRLAMRGAQKPHVCNALSPSGVPACFARTTNIPAHRHAALRPRPSPSRGTASPRGASSRPACSAVAQQSAEPDQQQQQPLISLEAREASADNFAAFGQVHAAPLCWLLQAVFAHPCACT